MVCCAKPWHDLYLDHHKSHSSHLQVKTRRISRPTKSCSQELYHLASERPYFRRRSQVQISIRPSSSDNSTGPLGRIRQSVHDECNSSCWGHTRLHFYPQGGGPQWRRNEHGRPSEEFPQNVSSQWACRNSVTPMQRTLRLVPQWRQRFETMPANDLLVLNHAMIQRPAKRLSWPDQHHQMMTVGLSHTARPWTD